MIKEHQDLLDDVSKEIFDYRDNIWIIKDISEYIHTKFDIASPYLNLRDALFHYKKMYEAAVAKNDFNVTQQYACIEEHLNRGLKDFAVYLCTNFFTVILHRMIDEKASSITNEIRQRLRHIYHQIKNLVIDIRFEGQILSHFKNHNINWLPTLNKVSTEFYRFLNESRPVKQLYIRFTNEMFNNKNL
ncbi:MAG: hypothetical protein LBK66_11165 [Spirochaetaceae bacterium]|jgi:hypothetical protein|nr:hypothetical protein [Spirochaetaceae bacterium]